MRVLVLNAGSSSLKASLVEAGGDRLASAQAEWARSDDDAAEVDGVIDRVLGSLERASEAAAVGHRVVHGGSRYVEATRVDDELVTEVERLDPLAPLHNRRAALVIRAAIARFPDLPQIACFDTAFHATLPEEAYRYALPDDWVAPRGIRRFGFHGLSVAWSVRRAAELLDAQATSLSLVVAHLGAGSSVTAVAGGRSIATSMGYTPFEGLVMGTRSGSIDPGILLELLRTGVTPEELADGIGSRSGLRALSGSSPDVRALEEQSRDGDDRAELALAVYARSAASAIASAATALERLDALVFTGGIGEHSARVRGDVARRLAVLGVPPPVDDLDGDGVLAGGPPAVLVVEAREDLVVDGEVTRTISPP